MRLLVTGGTGFVGGHVVAAAVRAGYDVRLLVRRPEQVPVTMAPLGVRPGDLELMAGDVLDAAAVDRALTGCESVVHAAAVYSLNPRHADEVRRTNARAAELVLTSAAERGLDPVVHVSSTVALTRHGGSAPDLPLSDVDWPYTRSKVASEEVARALQARGASVAVVYPGGVFGPHDPYRGEQSERLRWLLLGLFPLYPRGSTHAVDARTVADTVMALLEPGRGPRRYVVPGDRLDAHLMYTTVERVTGRRPPYAVLPGPVARPLTRAMAVLQRPLPDRLHYPGDPEGVEVNLRDTVFDDTPARTELGVEPVTFEESIHDTTRWLVESGRLRPRFAGKALGSA